MPRLLQLANNAVSKLSANIAASDTTLAVLPGDGAKFPSLSGGKYFMGTLVKVDGSQEIVKVTARAGDAMTVVRAAEPVGTTQTALSFSAGDRFELRLTGKALADELDRLGQQSSHGVQNKSAAYTVTAADSGDLIRVNTAAADVVVTLPLLSSLTDDFEIIIAKVTGDDHKAQIKCSGSNTINGQATFELTTQFYSAWLIADRTGGNWTAVMGGGNGSSSLMITDAFTGDGTKTVFDLSGDPGGKNNTIVVVGGVPQLRSTYDVAGASVTLGAAPAAGIQIEVWWWQAANVASLKASSISYTGAPTGSVTRTLSAVLDDIVNVKTFGAKGDGTSDDAPALALVASYVNSISNDGRPVLVMFPDGTYRLNSGVVFTRPVVLQASGSATIDYRGTGDCITFGPAGLSESMDFLHDHYIVDGLCFIGGKTMRHGVHFRPYVGLMAQIQNTSCVNFGQPSSWAFYFEVNNWWPTIFNNRWSSNDDQAQNWVMVAGANGTTSDGGNSRVTWIGNKGKWQGLNPGGIGLYTNAVKATIKDSAFEHAYSGIRIGPNSLFTVIEGCYFEQALNGASIRMGDDTGSQTVSNIQVKDTFANLHNYDSFNSSGVFIATANPNVKVTNITLDGVKIAQGGKLPAINLNNFPDQNDFRFGEVYAPNMSMLGTHTGMLYGDPLYAVEGKSYAVNGDLSQSSVTYPLTVTANSRTTVATGWEFSHDFSAPASVQRNALSAADISTTRGALYELAFTTSGTGTTNGSILVTVPDIRKLAGTWVTMQFFAKASPAVDLKVFPKVVWSAGQESLCYNTFTTKHIAGAYEEVTISFLVPNTTLNSTFSGSSSLVVEINIPTSGYIAVAGLRVNKGQAGLSLAV